MRGLTYILTFLFAVACASSGEPIETEDLEIEFEELWWEIIDDPIFLGSETTYCYLFNGMEDYETGADGRVIYFEEGDVFSYFLTDFERVDDGYYIPEYDIFLEILVDEEGNYSAKAHSGILSREADIIPCSLE